MRLAGPVPTEPVHLHQRRLHLRIAACPRTPRQDPKYTREGKRIPISIEGSRSAVIPKRRRPPDRRRRHGPAEHDARGVRAACIAFDPRDEDLAVHGAGQGRCTPPGPGTGGTPPSTIRAQRLWYTDAMLNRRNLGKPTWTILPDVSSRTIALTCSMADQRIPDGRAGRRHRHRRAPQERARRAGGCRRNGRKDAIVLHAWAVPEDYTEESGARLAGKTRDHPRPRPGWPEHGRLVQERGVPGQLALETTPRARKALYEGALERQARACSACPTRDSDCLWAYSSPLAARRPAVRRHPAVRRGRRRRTRRREDDHPRPGPTRWSTPSP